MRKTPHKYMHLNNENTPLENFDREKNKLFDFPFLNKKEWLDIPVLGNKLLSIQKRENFDISKQKNKDSCGLCAGKMVVNMILKTNGMDKRIDEQDIIKNLFLPKIALIKKVIGITPTQLQVGVQETLNENHLEYTAEIEHFISYPQIREYLDHNSYLIFTYMGNTIDNPYKFKNGKKDMMLKCTHHPHYCILLKIDEQQTKVTIANPFGYEEELSFKDFRQRISLHPKYLHSSKLYLPLVESGFYMPRSCIIVHKNT